MDYLFYLFIVLFFIAITLLAEGVLIWWNTTRGPEAQRIARRIRLMSAGAHKGDDEPLLLKKRLLAEAPALAKALLQVPRVHQVDRLLEQSGLSWTVGRFFGLSLVCFVAAFVVARILSPVLAFQLFAAFAGAFIPFLYVLRKRHQRLEKFEEQLPEALDLIGRALRAGHAFPSALKMVGDEMPDPIAIEFRVAFDEVNYGISMQAALTNLAVRVPSMDLRYFVIAVLIQRETGGNLSEILNNISTIIRERLKLLGKVRVLATEGRMSAWILGLLPFVTGFVIFLINPGFIRVLWFDPAGQKLIAAALVMMLIGFFWMRKIIRIHI